jgi:signal transduction histidine kinase
VRDLSLHILDIAENSVRAGARCLRISLTEDEENDTVTLVIEDDGRGMSEEMLQRAADPFFTTKDRKRHGMGLALLAQATREAEGEFDISSEPGAGTKIRATFRCSHPDRKPFGDIPATLEALVAGNPDVALVYEQRKGDEVMRLDTRRTK